MTFKRFSECGFSCIPNEGIRDESTGMEYRRIVGGLVWPGINPGFAVIVGEEQRQDPVTQMYPYRVLKEYEASTPEKLIRRCSELNSLYTADTWYGDNQNQPMMECLYRSDAKFYLQAAPFIDDLDGFQSYLLLIKELTEPTQKLLHFGEDSCIPDCLRKIATDSIPKQSTPSTISKDFPQVSALGFAVTALKHIFHNPNQQAYVAALNASIIT